MSTLETLLHASIEVARLRKQIDLLQAENAQLRLAAKARLWTDLQHDQIELGDELPALLRPQI